MFLSNTQNCYVTSPNSVAVETPICDQKRVVELIFTSYHGAQAYRDELLHGFVLVYNSKRKASLSTLSAFSNNIPNTPTQLLAVVDGPQGAHFYSNELSHLLVTQGEQLADKLHAHFVTVTASQKQAVFAAFLREVWDRKPQIEKAFDMDGSEYSLERHTPLLPPNVPSRQSVDSEEGIYEHIPSTENPSSPYLDRERNTPLSPSDDSEIYAQVAQHDVTNGEQLVKPSQMKNRRSLQAGKLRGACTTSGLFRFRPVS